LTAGDAVVLGVAAPAWALGALRWLRVAQREHYLAGSVSRFAWRWARSTPLNAVVALAGVVAAAFALVSPWVGLLTAATTMVWPIGLPPRGRTAKLAWTRRLGTLAAVAGAVEVGILLLGAAVGRAGAVASLSLLVLAPLLDAALAVLGPIERRFQTSRYVDPAARRLRSIAPTIVAITGSYGKTTTKGYIAHLLAASRAVVATPRSFNNRAGLARAINESLPLGTQVFIAEMGTYGPGEIADMCSWVVPDIAVITAVGPVHLERMRSEDAIAEAKAEILEAAKVAVLNVDDPRLSALADRHASLRRVVRCSAHPGGGDVCVVAEGSTLRVEVAGRSLGEVATGDDAPGPAMASNLACAVAVALELDVPDGLILDRLASVPVAPNRLTASQGAAGFTIIDDTFNSNPAGARAALEALRFHATPGHRVVVVSPGMVELGAQQEMANQTFASDAAGYADELIWVGRTNRQALTQGASGGSASIRWVPTRQEAVAWVREHLGAGDVVLYENDLPDHYP
jgi:UDP-N-acetylmuramoyl-tripeptide--D-alanyl-D-alanine ligase